MMNDLPTSMASLRCARGFDMRAPLKVAWRWRTSERAWCLEVEGRNQVAANVWDNGTWHTWGEDGVGGENSSEDSVTEAKLEATLSAHNQGFLE